MNCSNKQHDCSEVISRVFLALDGELTHDEETEFMAELNRCSWCLEQFNIEKAFKEFSDRMESLSTFRKTSDTVRANSATAVRQAGAADLGISGRETEMFGRALSGANPSGVIGVAGREQMNALLARQMDEPTRAMLLRILTSQNPQEQAATLAAIRVLQVPQPGAAGFTGPMNVPGSRRYGGLFPILMGNQTGLLSQ